MQEENYFLNHYKILNKGFIRKMKTQFSFANINKNLKNELPKFSQASSNIRIQCRKISHQLQMQLEKEFKKVIENEKFQILINILDKIHFRSKIYEEMGIKIQWTLFNQFESFLDSLQFELIKTLEQLQDQELINKVI